MRGVAARRRVPVDLAHVVAGLVGTDPVELEAGPTPVAAVVAAHPAADSTVEREFELVDEPVGDGARPRSRRRPCSPTDPCQVRGSGHAVVSPAISRRGAGTSVMTLEITLSAVIPSARAA